MTLQIGCEMQICHASAEMRFLSLEFLNSRNKLKGIVLIGLIPAVDFATANDVLGAWRVAGLGISTSSVRPKVNDRASFFSFFF